MIYAGQNLPLPAERIFTTISRQPILPYFNAGFIAVEASLELAKAWARICRDIDADPRITHKRPWLDQIGLPVAVKSLGVDFLALDQRFNFPAHLQPVNLDQPPCFAHYHRPKVVLSSPALRKLCWELAAEHPDLARSMQSDANWHPVLREPGSSLVERGRKLLRHIFAGG